MNPDKFDSERRALEYFHGLRTLAGTWAIIRVDGRGFSKLTEKNYDKPFDAKLHEVMAKVTLALVEGMNRDPGDVCISFHSHRVSRGGAGLRRGTTHQHLHLRRRPMGTEHDDGMPQSTGESSARRHMAFPDRGG